MNEPQPDAGSINAGTGTVTWFRYDRTTGKTSFAKLNTRTLYRRKLTRTGQGRKKRADKKA